MKHATAVKYDTLLKMHVWACTCGKGTVAVSREKALFYAATHLHKRTYGGVK